MSVQIVPLRIENGEWVNAKLAKMAENFCREEFGKFVPLKGFQSLWVAIRGNNGTSEVVGIMACLQRLDVNLFHVTTKNHDARTTTARMIKRLESTLLDAGFEGKEVLIHCAPEAQDIWRDFFKTLDARPADRFAVIVKSPVEV